MCNVMIEEVVEVVEDLPEDADLNTQEEHIVSVRECQSVCTLWNKYGVRVCGIGRGMWYV